MPAAHPNPTPDIRALGVRRLGLREYRPVWLSMQGFTNRRTPTTPDELWLVQHPPVFTLGQAGRREHLLNPGAIPIVQCDRGGQVTYHGPGQLVAYVLTDLRRSGLGVRGIVGLLEQSVIALLDSQGIPGGTKPSAPGVYVAGRKIASLGLRVRRGCTYHGISLNVDMDLEPFGRINPCGVPGLEVTQMADLQGPSDLEQVASALARQLTRTLGYAMMSEIDTGTLP